MNKRIICFSLLALALLVFSGVVMAEGVLVFSDSFEEYAVGTEPNGWTLVHPTAGEVVDSSFVSIPDGNAALRLFSTPNDNGEVFIDIPEVKKGKLVVDFYQPSSSRDNINFEVRNGVSRVVGVFITGSGNVRPRADGVQTANLINLRNDQWHTFVIRWDVDAKTFQVAYMEGDKEVAIADAGKTEFGVDPAGIGLSVSRIAFNVTRRDPGKEAFIDNIRVYDLAK